MLIDHELRSQLTHFYEATKILFQVCISFSSLVRSIPMAKSTADIGAVDDDRLSQLLMSCISLNSIRYMFSFRKYNLCVLCY